MLVSTDQFVEETVNEFVKDNQLFTALDVSNKVKESRPYLRHREIRDIVRQLWFSTIQNNGYGRTPISVTLNDGSSTEAVLYHPLADSWDLDNKYDTQKRMQLAKTPLHKPVVSQPVTQSVVAQPVVTQPVVPVQPPAPKSPKDIWDNLFSTTDSIFKP